MQRKNKENSNITYKVLNNNMQCNKYIKENIAY